MTTDCHPREAPVLEILEDWGAMTVRQLADELGLDPTTVRARLVRLHRRGLVAPIGQAPTRGPARKPKLWARAR